MKRTGHLYEKLFDLKNIEEALLETCEHKSKRRIVQKIKADPKHYAKEIKRMLEEGFFPSSPKRFERRDPGSGKIRKICSVPLYPDQAIHRLAVNVMKESIVRGMDPHCVGCVPGRGCNAGMKAVRKWARKSRKKRIWVIKADVYHYYENIDRDKLFEMLETVIKDKRFLVFLWNITSIEPKGLAIGVYSSTWLANFYLQGIDHFLKEKVGLKHVARNVDDYVWMDPSKRRLLRAKAAADGELAKLGLKLKPDWRIFALRGNDVDFVGYRIHYDGKVTIRKRTWKKLRRDCLIAKHHRLSVKRARSLLSRMGYAMNSNGRKIFEKYLDGKTVRKAKEIAKKEDK